MIPDFNESLRFMKFLYPRGPWMLTAISPDKKFIEARTFQSTEEEDFLAWLNLHAKKNLYYSVNEPMPGAFEKKKLSKSDVSKANFVHVDLDPHVGEDVEMEQARILKAIRAYRIPPSVVVFSGGGYNALWRLDQSVSIAEDAPSPEEAIRRAIDFERRNWQMELDFNTQDHCRDISRILRLPGTINRLNAEKVAKGRVQALSFIVEMNDIVYPFSAFMATPSVSVTTTSSPSTNISQDIVRLESVDHLPKDVPQRVRVIIAQGFDPDDKNYDGDRSNPLMYVCCELFRCGIPDSVILGIITDSRYGISASVLDKGSRVMDYAVRQVGRAKDRAFDPLLAEMNDKYAVIANYGGFVRILVREDDGDFTFLRPKEFKDGLDNIKKEYFDAKGKPKTVGIASWWFDQRRRKQYNRIRFEPGLETPGDLNLWQGFAVQPREGTKHQLFLKHVFENICLEDQQNYDYLIKWMARVVQYPRTQSMTAPIILGVRGTGKSIFATEWFAKLFGSHAYIASEADEITGKFNAHQRHCVVFIGEEAFDQRDRRHESVLKMMITGARRGVEMKGVDRSQMSNYIHLMMLSNQDKVVPAGDHERRYFVIRVRDKKSLIERGWNDQKFLQLLDDAKSGGLENFLHFLLSVDLSNWNVTSVPQTRELRQQQEHNIIHQHEWLLEKLETGVWLADQKSPWEGPILKEALYDDYIRYTKNIQINRPLAPRSFRLWLKREFPDLGDRQLSSSQHHSRPWAFVFPTLTECRAQFLQNRGWVTHDWMQNVLLVTDPQESESNQKKVF